VGTAALGCPAGRSPAAPAVNPSSQRESLPAFSSSQHTWPQSTPPCAALGCRDAAVPSAAPPHQTPASHPPPDDARARKRTELEYAHQSRSSLLCTRSWPQTAPNPTPAPAATVHNPPHSRDCKTPTILSAMELHPHAPAQCSAHPIRIPAAAAPHAAMPRSPTSPPA
jgi:hypothetical protein